jgi:hypothetical protein
MSDANRNECSYSEKPNSPDLISRQEALKALRPIMRKSDYFYEILKAIQDIPSAQPEEVMPHRNYKYLSDYWCECGWHLGKKGEVKYCSECGRKVNWDE